MSSSEISNTLTSYSAEVELVTATQWGEEWTARDTASVRLQLLGRVLCCRNKPRIRWIRSKGAILVLLWTSLVLNFYGNLGLALARIIKLSSVHADREIYLMLVLIQALSQLLLYPLAGWIADVYFGRYRVIKIGLWLQWAGAILLGLGVCLITSLPLSDGKVQLALKVVLLSVPFIAVEVGIAAFDANVIPFGTDQLPTGSGYQLSGFITWYVFTSTIQSGVLKYPFSCPWVDNDSDNLLLQLLFQVVLLSAALILNSFFKHWLIMEPRTSNPFKLVARVLRYVWKNKQPQFRSAFTYQDHTKPSRIEFAKESFGGPFTTEQVEDVKTFLRIVIALLPLGGILALLTFLANTSTLFSQHVNSQNIPCFGYQAVSNYLSYFVILFAVFLYELFIYPIMHNYIPNVWIRFGIGIILHMLCCVALFVIDFVGHEEDTAGTNYTCMYDEAIPAHDLYINPFLTMLPKILIGLGTFFNITAVYEFVFSQSPHNMKGLFMGAIYVTNGLFLLLTLSLQVPFYLGYLNHLTGVPSCGSVYLSLWLTLTIVWFIVYVLVARCYHKRERGETKRQQNYAEEYYSKYLTTRHSIK